MFLAASNLPTAELLTDFVWVFGVGALVVAVLHTRKLPSLLGFLLTGLLVGPAGFGLVQDRAAIEVMAEIGIVLLLFTIGLEISLKELARIARQVVGGGLLQIGATTVAVTAIGHTAGLPMNTALAIGLIASASSTALVLRLLGDRGELRLPHGQLSLAILLMQDFAVVVLMLVLPMLAAGEIVASALLMTLARAIAISVGIVVVARFVFPWVLARVVDLRSREVFLLTSVVAVFGTAWVADAAGLSLALGAFLAGIVISESEFSHQMTAEVMPFRDVLNGLFFVSVGLLIDRDVLFDNFGLLVGLAVGALLLKATIVYITGRAFRLNHHAALLTGIALSQVGEFALVLAQQAANLELLNAEQHSMLISVSVMTMLVTPLALPVAGRLLRAPAAAADAPDLDGDTHDLDDHVIVIGFGINGQNVARALRQLQVRFIIVEMNRNTVTTARGDGFPIIFGDATTPALLHHLGIEKARALVSCIADAAATREVVANAHHANPELLIIARTRYVAEIAVLRDLGADSVVPEEFETSVELIGRVMRAYGAPEPTIQREKHNLRSEHYRALLEDAPPEVDDFSHLLQHVAAMEAVVGAAVAGRTFAELDLRRNCGATAIAVIRDGVSHAAPDGDFELLEHDRVILVGDASALDAARKALAKHDG